MAKPVDTGWWTPATGGEDSSQIQATSDRITVLFSGSISSGAVELWFRNTFNSADTGSLYMSWSAFPTEPKTIETGGHGFAFWFKVNGTIAGSTPRVRAIGRGGVLSDYTA